MLPTLLCALGAACAGVAAPPAAGSLQAIERVQYAAIVDARHAGADGSRVGGVSVFRTIQAALRAAPDHAAEPHVILVRAGRYREKLSVEKPNIRFAGEGADRTVLTYDAAAGHIGENGAAWGTRGSFTLRVAAPDFTLIGMRVENGFDYTANAALEENDPHRVRDAQAVALLLDHGSDRSAFADCVISGHQDTLFADAGRSYFRGCTIIGHVDFIFGAGQAVFDACDIVSRDRGRRTNNGYITAPSTPLAQPYGFLFVRSRLLKETPAMAAGTVALGRPWRPSGAADAVGSAVFIDCFMDDHIGEDGWVPMSAGYRGSGPRFYEHGSHGPGARTSASRTKLSADLVAYYDIDLVLRGWQPVLTPGPAGNDTTD